MMTANPKLKKNDNQPILDIRNLHVEAEQSSKNIPILTNISFSLKKGEILSVIGESGSGLTVLSKSIMNWLPRPLFVSKGSVLFRSQNILNLSTQDLRKFRGKIFAYIGSDSSTALNPTVPIGKHLVSKLRAVMPEYSDTQAQRRIIDLFDAVRIPSPKERFNEFPFQFSGGMMQRVMIVDALCTDPELLVADNITQPLDVTIAKQIVRLLYDLRDEFGTSVLFSTASLPMAADISEKLLVLQNGRVLEETTPEEIVNNPGTNYTKALSERVPRIWTSKHIPSQSISKEAILSVKNVSK